VSPGKMRARMLPIAMTCTTVSETV